jgi:hypothetical protein
MTRPRSFAGNTVKFCGICSLVAVIDPMPLVLFGCAIILVALFMTWRPMPKSKS